MIDKTIFAEYTERPKHDKAKCQFCKKDKTCYYLKSFPCIGWLNGDDGGHYEEKKWFTFPNVWVCVDCLKKGSRFRFDDVMGGVVDSFVADYSFQKDKFYDDEI